jgi:hypothetical protein
VEELVRGLAERALHPLRQLGARRAEGDRAGVLEASVGAILEEEVELAVRRPAEERDRQGRDHHAESSAEHERKPPESSDHQPWEQRVRQGLRTV